VQPLTIDRAAIPGSAGTTVNTSTDADGTAKVTLTASTLVGDYDYTVSSNDLPTQAFTEHVAPGPPAKIVVSAPKCPTGTGTSPPCAGIDTNGDVRVGENFAALVKVQDQYGNNVDSDPSVTITRSALGTVGPQSVTFNTGGDGSHNDGTINKTLTAPTVAALGASPALDGTSYHYTVSSGALPTKTFDINVIPGPPTNLTIDTVADQANTGFLAKAKPFDVTVSSRDQYGNLSRLNQTVTLSTSGGQPPTNLGTLTSTPINFNNAATKTFLGATYSGYGNHILLTATSPGLTDGTQQIDVNLFVETRSATPGTPLNVTNTNCTDATPQVPVCTSLILNKGAKGTVTAVQGACDPFTNCLAGPTNQALLLNAIADLHNNLGAPLYTRSAPAIIQLRCDKTLCGGKATNKYPLIFQPTTGGFATAPSCPKKGQIGPNQTYCQDLVQTRRDNAGDLITYLLFLEDAKASFKP
jgi:hypothetical protein